MSPNNLYANTHKTPVCIPGEMVGFTCHQLRSIADRYDRTDTQDTLLGQEKAERLIEVGPANTLANMAKRTLAQPRYADSDAASSRNRRVLSCHTDHDEIYHVGATEDVTYDINELPSTTVSNFGTETPSLSDIRSDTSRPSPSQGSLGSSHTTTNRQLLQDQPITSKQILTFLVAYKLKRTMADIPPSNTIKTLVKGKSTIAANLERDQVTDERDMQDDQQWRMR